MKNTEKTPVASLSHDLRTPLNSLLMLAKLLSDNEGATLTEKQLEYARAIHSAGEDLLALISELVDLSKIESGKLEVYPKRVLLCDMLDYVQAKSGPAAARQGIRLSATLSSDAPTAIRTDAPRVQQILDHVLRIATHCAQHRAIEVSITRAVMPGASGSRQRDAIAFRVREVDGNPATRQRTGIFAALGTPDEDSRLHGRLGLGLTISQALARLLGGVLQVHHAPGSASEWTLYLPAADPAQASLSAPPSRKKAPAEAAPAWLPAIPRELHDLLAGRRILAVEDDARNLFALTCLLERCGAQVVPASTAQEALDALAQPADMDLVLMDLMLPGTDGFAATRAIRGDPRHQSLPIIALTASADSEHSGRSFGAGCSAFLTKPLHMPAFQQAVAQLFAA